MMDLSFFQRDEDEDLSSTMTAPAPPSTVRAWQKASTS